MNNDIVTVVEDPRRILGKQFSADGKKTAVASMSFGVAKQYHVSTADDLVGVLKLVADNPNAALINSSFPDIPVGAKFLILSEAELSDATGKIGRQHLVGLHHIQHQGSQYAAVGRFKENVLASRWQILDRDIDEHTPPEFKSLLTGEWLQTLEKIIPGITGVERIETKSSSARVLRGNEPLSKSNGHIWIRVADPSDLDRFRTALTVQAMAAGQFWKKPKYSSADPTQVVGYGTAMLLDTSVFVRGRLTFNGKPTASPPLKVIDQEFRVVTGGLLDTSLVKTLDRSTIRQIAEQAGFAYQVHLDRSGSISIHQYNLSSSTELELECGNTVSVEEALDRLLPGAKLRCQAPFRASTSFAAFLARSAEGKPFVHDVGTSTTHWLCDEDAAAKGYSLSIQHGPTLAETRNELDKIPAAELETRWAELARHLNEVERMSIIDHVKSRLPNLSKATLKASMQVVMAAYSTTLQQLKSGGRQLVVFSPSDTVSQSLLVEDLILRSSKDWEYVEFGGVPCSLERSASPQAADSLPRGSFPVLNPINEADMRARVERVAVFGAATKDGFKPGEIPATILKNLLHLTDERHAPRVQGLLLHPTVLLDGTILNVQGVDDSSGLLMLANPMGDVKPYSKRQAHQALKRLKKNFLDGFDFEEPIDEDVAISAFFTGVIRRSLPQAPGYAILATVQASGKTTLARRLHLMITGHDLVVQSFPEGDASEARKKLLAALMQSRPMICFDNYSDGFTFESPVLAAMMTSPTYEDRLLGESQLVSAPTNTLFVLTGNNLALGSDEVSRWLVVRLNPRSTSPHQRKFKNADVVTHALKIREEALRDVIGIVAGYLANPRKLPPSSRFPDWDRMVRQPIMWAGGADTADVFETNLQNSPSRSAPEVVLSVLGNLYGSAPFTAQQVAAEISLQSLNTSGGDLAKLYEALVQLKAKSPTKSSSAGRALSSIVNRHVSTAQGVMKLTKSVTQGTTYYKVESV